ncbi:hypothetical protein AcW1_006817 [Taiwanofungus camphoratus]|nr:hypothetical protein AcV5_009404 [Antrodia cinnamomea]KAI0924808.1 hypothetical protein AcW2_005579 [Antrodia cinnamomea]KAI0953831.1 hypothetical protein AcV7_007250 [Antrodia cinnamomea]KAI0955149.1 hypothetical protein AcW1_006817 [Antrodia cinnamomea]
MLINALCKRRLRTQHPAVLLRNHYKISDAEKAIVLVTADLAALQLAADGRRGDVNLAGIWRGAIRWLAKSKPSLIVLCSAQAIPLLHFFVLHLVLRIFSTK